MKPHSVMAAFDLPQGFKRSINKTKELIEQGETIIYEAGLMYNNAHCFVDILVQENGKWNLYEVKSSGSISDVYIYDAAFQYYILKNLDLNIGDASIVYVNKEYKQKKDIDVKKYFKIESVFKRIKELQPYVEKQLLAETEILQKTKIPEIERGDQCTEPYRCDFIGYCWNDETAIL
ncbi:MAG: CRISPR-associated protein Cas4 [Bacteroidales bacterium]|nr:CRISPR-associated protein Cas4 [Bacteroidales bacterium]